MSDSKRIESKYGQCGADADADSDDEYFELCKDIVLCSQRMDMQVQEGRIILQFAGTYDQSADVLVAEAQIRQDGRVVLRGLEFKTPDSQPLLCEPPQGIRDLLTRPDIIRKIKRIAYSEYYGADGDIVSVDGNYDHLL